MQIGDIAYAYPEKAIQVGLLGSQNPEPRYETFGEVQEEKEDPTSVACHIIKLPNGLCHKPILEDEGSGVCDRAERS